MELKQSNLTEISVRLLNSGRYVWTILTQCETQDRDQAIETIKQIDTQLKDKFPDHSSRGSGFTKDLEE